jgi:hypothetical protein
MALNNKRKTTIANGDRETNRADSRPEKQARKAARKQAATHEEQTPRPSPAQQANQPLANRSAVDAATQAFSDMAKADAKSQG